MNIVGALLVGFFVFSILMLLSEQGFRKDMPGRYRHDEQ